MLKPLALMLVSVLATGGISTVNDGDETPRLIGQAAISGRFIVFSYAGDLWRAEHSGGAATPLTQGRADDAFPTLSNDGSLIAFSRRDGGDWDLYTISIDGGEPRQLTFNPEADIARGWSPDDQSILFMSHREEEGIYRLYTIERNGAFPEPLPLPRGFDGSFSPDGDKIAYVPYALPLQLFDLDWRYYRGGAAAPLWIADLDDGSIERVPRENSNDMHPMWVGDSIFFVSDRSGTHNLYLYTPRSRDVEQLTAYTDYGVTHAAAGGGMLVFVQDGGIRRYNPTTGAVDSIDVQVSPDTSELAPRSVPIAPYIQSAAISRLGDQVVFEARGDIISYDRLSGQAVNITNSPDVADRYPSLSPDGQWLGYESDDNGEYKLKLRRADGSGEVQRTGQIELRPTFYRDFSWSPNSNSVAFIDKRLSLWVTNLETGGARRVATSTYSDQGSYQVSWSPNGTIMAYSEYGENRNRIIYLYDIVRGRMRQVTRGDSSAEHPVFDKSGKYLYFVASDNSALSEFGWSVLSGALQRPLVTRRLHVVVLRNDIPAPVLPLTGEPNMEAQADSGIGRALIHTDGIDRRTVPLPLQAKDFAGLVAGRSGELYILINEWPDSPALGRSPKQSLYRYRLAEPKRLAKFLDDIDEFQLSADASTILYRRGQDWAVVPAAEPPEPGAGRLDLESIQVDVDPPAEWRQIYHEAWRLMRDYFYDPDHHGQNIREIEAHYANYLPSVTRRSDLNALLNRALGHVSVSHLVARGGDIPLQLATPSRVGLLGADYEVRDGRYRITRIYRSGHYNSPDPLLQAPLDQPGIDVAEGEYLLEVDGEPVLASRNIYSYFQGKAFTPVRITVGPDPQPRALRTYTVVPLPGENTLRRANWAESNRRRIDEQSQGQLAYIYVRDYTAGVEDFLRGMLGKPGAKGFVIDQRFAHGGITSDFLIEALRRRPIYYYAFRNGDDIAVPTNPMPNSKVLLINDVNSSAAETFALMFKLGRVGRVIGTRTMGAGIGPYAFVPKLIDGGSVTIPNRAAYNPSGSWDIENDGVSPNIEVEWMPKDWREGRDPQLDAAVKAVLQHIVDNADRLETPTRPDYPVHPTGKIETDTSAAGKQETDTSTAGKQETDTSTAGTL